MTKIIIPQKSRTDVVPIEQEVLESKERGMVNVTSSAEVLGPAGERSTKLTLIFDVALDFVFLLGG